MSYNPNPTRVWSRVQDRCTYIDSSNNAAYQNVYVPLTGKTVTLGQAIYQDKLISKGNILQYKKNSSNLTKKQKYTQICKGMWTNRTKSYSTQTQTYTNPNTSNLLQVNYNSVPSTGTTYINGPYKYNIPSPYGCVSTIIKDGGSLLCNTIANPCTNEVIETTTILKCYPTTCSDVPGPEQLLCWDERLNTWYPRQRYTMPTSGTGWPEGYKGFVSAEKPPTPILTLDSTNDTSITLSWTVSNDDCIPISSYNIYLNGQIYTTVSYTTKTITISDLCGTNTFNVTSVSRTIESDKSNTVTVIKDSYVAVNAVITNNYKTITFLQNGSITFYCSTTIKYTLVGGGGSGGYNSGPLVTGLPAGGGGHVMNSTSNYTMNPGNSLTIAIGAGGIAPIVAASGAIGGDTSLSGTISNSTTNSTYSGGGGGGTSGIAYSGGGGSGNGTTSNLGGTYLNWYSSNDNNGTGGAGGSLTTETLTLTTLGNIGGSNSLSAAGNGGAGQLGIDGNYYGGGGGGGIKTGGIGGGGGSGGGGGGATPTSGAIAGNPNTGGGGGGGYYLNSSIYPSANGGSGRAIIMIM